MRERCKILEDENARLKEELRKAKKVVAKKHDPNCDGDLWICDDCRGVSKVRPLTWLGVNVKVNVFVLVKEKMMSAEKKYQP